MKKIVFFLFLCLTANALYSQGDMDSRSKPLREKRQKRKTQKTRPSDLPTRTAKKAKPKNNDSEGITGNKNVSPNSDVSETTIPEPRIKNVSGSFGVISGKIIESTSGESLMDAAVQIEGYNLAVLANPEGNFRLEKILPGEYKMLIRYIGYVGREVKVKVAAGKELFFESIPLAPDGVGLKEVEIISQISKSPSAPLSISTIDYNYIAERQSGQEVPELLKLTPSVYTSKAGGGFGDSRINIRGFDQTNVAVLINGIPVNDMENGRVFWSNWVGVGDVARTIQVQRGLGASKIAINSIGGTMNLITKTTDVEKGGSVILESSNRYNKLSVSLSTGRTKKGWAVSFVGSRTYGSGYIDKTDLSAWSYFLSVTKEIGSRHILSFTAFGAPQEHNQRLSQSSLKTYGIQNNNQFNPDWGYLDGKPLASIVNTFHKPQFALNHYFHITDKLNLSSSVYFSIGRGGGTGIFTANNYRVKTDSNGQIDFEAARSNNRSKIDSVNTSRNGLQMGYGSDMILSNSVNNHTWIGALSILNYQINSKWKAMGGIDLRYYNGYHYREVDNLLGGDFFVDTRDKNNPINAAKKGDIFDYNYDGRVRWSGIFGQIEYASDKITAFLSSSGSITAQQRYDYFIVKGINETSKMMYFPGYNVKAGFSYKITPRINAYINGGTFSRAPFFNFLFVDRRRSNDLSQNPVNEKILSGEIGSAYRSDYFTIDACFYYTVWKDKGNNFTFTDNQTKSTRSANITGIGARHMGIELEGVIKPLEILQIKFSGSVGDWRWLNDVNAVLTNELNQETRRVELTIKDLHVGDAAQTTAGIGARVNIIKGLYAIADFTYFARLYANFNPDTRLIGSKGEVDRSQPYMVPDYGLFDIHAGYDFRLYKLQFLLKAGLLNVLDKQYIIEGTDGKTHSIDSLNCFYGFGRNFSLSLQIKF